MNQNESGTQELRKEIPTPQTDKRRADNELLCDIEALCETIESHKRLECELVKANDRAALFELVRVALGAETQEQALEIAEGLKKHLALAQADSARMEFLESGLSGGDCFMWPGWKIYRFFGPRSLRSAIDLRLNENEPVKQRMGGGE